MDLQLIDYLKQHVAVSHDPLSPDPAQKEVSMNIHGFIMDIKGNVELLCTTTPFSELTT